MGAEDERGDHQHGHDRQGGERQPPVEYKEQDGGARRVSPLVTTRHAVRDELIDRVGCRSSGG